jgi:membrane-associated protein
MTSALGPSWLDAQNLIGDYGLPGILAIVFAECGLLVGFFLPGDSLLFTAGLLVRDGTFRQPLWLVCLLITVAAILGNQVGYFIGRKAGPAVFRRPDSRLFKQEYVERTSAFFERHGPRAIVLARFVPIVRTFITVMAGAAKMDVRTYTIYSVIGGVLWGVGVTLLGWSLGGVPFIRNNVELILLAVVFLSVVPIGLELVRSRRRPRQNTPD